jgi:hypothetical protein
MAEGQWYYTQNGQQTGPISFYQLQQLASGGTLKSTDYVWTNGQEDWKPASEIAGLLSGGTSAPPPPSRAYPETTGSHDLVMPSDPPRDPTVMAILSFLLPGLGQIVLGQNVKGIVLIVLYFGVGFATACFGSLVVLIVAIIDAYQIAVKLRNGRPVKQWEFF